MALTGSKAQRKRGESGNGNWPCSCTRTFTTKSGRVRHMLKCDDVPERIKEALRR